MRDKHISAYELTVDKGTGLFKLLQSGPDSPPLPPLEEERIFEMYLNTVHWGKRIMGAEAASRKYFHTSSANITASQAALLAAILPNPTKWTPIKPSKYIRERQKEIMRQMVRMPLP